MAVTIACVLRSGGYYGPEWVYALRRGLNRHVDGSTYEFACLSDTFTPWQIPLREPWPGWWAKVELFRPGLFSGPVLYLDLDTLVVGDLSDLLAYRGAFAMLSDFYQPRKPASGVMAWTPGPHTEAIYEAMLREPSIPKGRSDYWYARHAPTPDRLQSLYPRQLVSLKAHCKPPRAKGPPEGARLVCGHGRPRFDTPAAGWAHREWKRAEFVGQPSRETSDVVGT